MVYAGDLKSLTRKGVQVRVLLGAPTIKRPDGRFIALTLLFRVPVVHVPSRVLSC